MQIVALLLTLLVIAIPICAFLALSQSNKALREIETLKQELNKLFREQSRSQPNDDLLNEIESIKSKLNKLSLEQRASQPTKTIDSRSISQERTKPTTVEEKSIQPSPLPQTTTEESLVQPTLWTESRSYEEGNTITVNYVLRTKDGKKLSEGYNKARLTLIRKTYGQNGEEKEIIESKLLNVFQSQVRSENFKADKEGQYQFILNYGPTGNQSYESESFTIIKKRATQESAKPLSAKKKTTAPLEPQKSSQTNETELNDSDIEPSDSLEIKLGTYWFVRIGVILLLTGLGFLAWFKKDFFLELSAATKISLFYFISCGMGGLGLWLHRRKKELQNFGQVLIAGSFAGTYFTTYAAHIFEPVKIIDNSSLALVLLFVLGALMVGVAEKLKSQTIALFAIGSSYYATYVPLIHQGTISPWIILASNLILAITSVLFMVRNQWFRIPALSMGASYLGFFIWRFLEKSPDFILVTLFLGSLWLVYTVAVFICKHKEFSDNERATFLTLNNAAVFGFMTWEVLKLPEPNFWILALSIGLILIGCAFISSRLLKKNPLTKNSYLIQGLSLATLGLMTTKQSESIKGPILAAETLVLLFSSTRLKNILIRYAAVATSIAAIVFGFISIENHSADYLRSSLTITAFLLAGGILSAKKIEMEDSAILRNFTTYFIGAAILMFTSALLYQYNHLEIAWISDPFYNLLILAAAPIIGCISYYFLRIRELTLLGQIPFFFVAAFSLGFIADQGSISQNITFLALTLCFIHWWKMQGHLIIDPNDHNTSTLKIPSIIEACYSVAIVAQIFSWAISTTMDKTPNGEPWLWLGPLLAISITIYSFICKLKYLGALSQLFLGFACLIQINICIDGHNDRPILALIPIVTLFATLLFLVGANKTTSSENYETIVLSSIKKLYAILLSLLTLLWVFNYPPPEYRSLVSIAIAIASYFVSTKSFIVDKKLIHWLSLSYLVTGFIYLALELVDGEASILSLIGILGLMSFQQFSKSFKTPLNISAKIHNVLILSASIALFWWCTEKVSDTSAELRTITWAGLAVINFLVGISLKERWYRLIGLSILGISLLSLIPIIWDMPTELKITSLFVLGGIFVGLGYIYTRYKDHIKKLL